VAHFSRRSAETFVQLVEMADLGAAARAATHVCLSADVAQGLATLGPPDTLIAGRPDEASLVATIAGRFASNGQFRSGTLLHQGASQRKAAAGMALAGDGMKRTDKSLRAGKPDEIREETREDTTGQSLSSATAPADLSPETPSAPVPAGSGEPGSSESGSSEPGKTDVPAPETPVRPALSASAGEEPLPPPAVAQAPQAPAAPARSGPGWAGVLIASLLAGGIGAGVATFLPGLISPGGGSGQQQAEQAALVARLATLERAATARPLAPAPPITLSPEAEAAVKAASAAAEATRADVRVLETRLQELAARPVVIAPGAPQPAPDMTPLLEPLQGEIGRAGQALAEARARQDAMTQQISALTERLATGAHAPAAASAAAARLVVLERIQGAVAAGRPFLAEATALERLGADPAQVAALKTNASGGVPSQTTLQQAFRAIRGPIAAEPTQADAPLTERLLRLTDGLVRVRASGDAQGSSPAALAARIDQALDRGETAQALALWRQLPEPARRTSEAFARQLETRATVDASLASLSQSALAALARAP
jgi:hypothetical protein